MGSSRQPVRPAGDQDLSAAWDVLEALAADWRALAEEIRDLGEEVSDPAGADAAPRKAAAIQRFDALNQRADACARVLASATALLRGGADPRDLTDVIAEVPVGESRARLLGALGDEQAIKGAIEDDPLAGVDVDWFS